MIIRETSQQLNALAKQKYSFDDPKNASEAEEYDNWLADTAYLLSDFANKTEELMEVTRDLAEMSNSFNLDYIALQQKISHENRQFTMVSNIMKTKHDTAKNSINNIR